MRLTSRRPCFQPDLEALEDRTLPALGLVSISTGGGVGNSYSAAPSISADGRFVAFESDADNLVAGDTNGNRDVFVRDRLTNVTTRVSVSTGGAQGNNASFAPSISADGRFIAFHSWADNLVAGDTNDSTDVFVHDRVTHTTTRVSLNSSGAQGNSDSYQASISVDGRYVAFSSFASNLVSGDSNNAFDVFVRDRLTNTTTRISLNSSGAQSNDDSVKPSLSGDGRYVAFSSYASNLVSGDTNHNPDVFVRDLVTRTTTRVSLNSSGAQGNGSSNNASLSADGRYVAFQSTAGNLITGGTNGWQHTYVHDRLTRTTTLVSVSTSGNQANSLSINPSISGNGRFVAFQSLAGNLVSGDSNGSYDVFVRDRVARTTIRVSVTSSGAQGNNDSESPALSADGSFVAFESLASNLVSGDSNGTFDVFVQDLMPTSAFSFLVSGGRYKVSSWWNGLTPIAGTATPTIFAGLLREEVSIRQVSTGRYWNGRAFVAAAESFFTASGTSSWSYAFPSSRFPADGFYSVHARAIDKAGHVEIGPTVFFYLDVAPRVMSITRADANPTGFSRVRWLVTFSEPVSGVNLSDFALVQGSGVRGAALVSVSGSGRSYIVTASTGTGATGTLTLRLVNNGSIKDSDGNVLLTSSILGQPYTINKLHAVTSLLSITLTQTGDPLHYRLVTIKNRTTTAIVGPIYLVLNSLPAGVTLANRSGTTSTGKPYLKIDQVLNAGSSLAQLLRFSNLFNVPVTFSVTVLAGLGTP